ncbi:hypothetical protein NKH77_17750 [Streptomyces sp. M19]
MADTRRRAHGTGGRTRKHPLGPRPARPGRRGGRPGSVVAALAALGLPAAGFPGGSANCGAATARGRPW